MKRFYKKLSITIAICLAVALGSVFAVAPNTINYQGRLTNNAGDPVADGAVLVKFVIYDAPVGGAVLWDAGFQNISTVNGLFSYELGSNVAFPNNLFADTVRWLGITIGVDPEISPRTRITATAFANQAINSDTAGIAATVLDNSITGVKIVDATIGSADIAPNAIQGFHIAAAQVGAVQIATDAIEPHHIKANAVSADEIAAAAVGSSEIAIDAVGPSEIAADAVGSAEISADAVGTSEVADNSLGAVDLSEEPGIAQRTSPGPLTITNDVPNVIDSRAINCPSAGYILAVYSAEFRFSHVTGASSVYTIYLSNNGTSFVNSVQKNIIWASTNPSATNYFIVSLNHIFPAVAGLNTINLVADRSTGDPDYTFDDRILSLVFFPTAYGTVDLNPQVSPNNEGEAHEDIR